MEFFETYTFNRTYTFSVKNFSKHQKPIRLTETIRLMGTIKIYLTMNVKADLSKESCRGLVKNFSPRVPLYSLRKRSLIYDYASRKGKKILRLPILISIYASREDDWAERGPEGPNLWVLVNNMNMYSLGFCLTYMYNRNLYV